MKKGIIHEYNMEKQSEKHMGGCIAGFFHFFDRNHVVSSKRLCPKRIPPSSAIESDSSSSFGSPVISREFDGSKSREPAKLMASPVDRLITPPPATVQDASARSSIAVSSFDFKEGLKSPSKFTRELPRLSLDSRLHPRGIRTSTSSAAGVVRYDDDRSDMQRRSPSVVARLMGLEPPLPSSHSGGGDLPEKKVELRRSASVSRSMDLLPSNAQYDCREKGNGGRYLSNKNNIINDRLQNGRAFDHGGYGARNPHPEPALKPQRMIAQPHQRKGLYDYGDFFPEPKATVLSSIYGDVEKRLKMRGIEEPSKDLESLKLILETLQFKGLLHHSKPPGSQIGQRNFVYDGRFPHEESPIIVMKPARSPRRLATEPSPPRFQSKTVPRRNPNVAGGESFSSRSPRRDPTLPGRSENRSTSPATTRRKVALSIETQRRLNETTSTESRRVSPVQSPRTGSRRVDQTASRSPRRRRSTAEDESSTISEKLKMEECYNDGKSLLERCNKLLDSISEMSSTSKNSTELQQSPVSVLDSSLYKEDESPSPASKRAVDFKDIEDEIWSPSSSDEDPDFAYVSEIIRASNYHPTHKDIFSLLEKKQQSIKGRNDSNSSILQRRLIFDTITEILDRNRQLQLLPWRSVPCRSQLSEIWSEIQRIQKRDESEDMFDVICGVMKRDLNKDSISGWGECQLELSEAVIDVQRLIYKDLIGETIQDLMGLTGISRKLVF